ncbi:uncharacterized protein N7443_004886 [Penicillium atrosanguineum]|uniref:Uncharacterized protein n=1 Tax=Penicillium atrosanguineum TaxID=1132637 RepID=A0A9W9U8B8_9EURO|nr:uncharacterized protein N7443_004886 [Penicillium atrosanguineum]KAJ5305226.1 hypothetical protein N7443_004886 [Penicillium atrosanguineum]KAJ5324691.1 hypothetical protein N7476_003291 [Penicillium atrosanguineum]
MRALADSRSRGKDQWQQWGGIQSWRRDPSILPQSDRITDELGKLQYIPFATCNETSRPLVLHYGVSETITCTIPSLSDSLYHLYEFYVHSDVPMTCRVPTAPLSSTTKADKESESGEVDSLAALNENGPPFTPVTVALQGTLQLSHLHIWTDMNMLMHNMASDPAAQELQPKHAQTGQPGYAVAGTAYSTPEFEATVKGLALDDDEESVALAQAAREPWTTGHGTKVVRGEPLTFSFHVAWVEGGAGIGWPERPTFGSFLGAAAASQSSRSGGIFSDLFLFVAAASFGAFAALYWERNGGRLRGRSGWQGDGILGAPPRGKGPGVTFGNGGRINGYGGYSAASNGAGTGGGGYGFPTGKRD